MSLADFIKIEPLPAKPKRHPIEAQPLDDGRFFFGPTGMGDALHKYIDSHQEERKLGGEWLHASSLYGLCTRQHAILRENGTEMAEFTPTSRRVVFDVGNALHHVVQNEYLGPAGLLYGAWRCKQCHAVVVSTMPERCGCGGRFMFKETTVRNEELKLMGRTDGELVRCPNEIPQGGSRPEGRGIIEIKSLEGNLFKILKVPQPAHVFQAQVYMFLTGLKWAIILYVSKSMEPKTPFRDWGTLYNPKTEETIRKIIAEAQAQGEKRCKTPDDKRARECVTRGACFFGEKLNG